MLSEIVGLEMKVQSEKWRQRLGPKRGKPWRPAQGILQLPLQVLAGTASGPAVLFQAL